MALRKLAALFTNINVSLDYVGVKTEFLVARFKSNFKENKKWCKKHNLPFSILFINN